MRTAEHEIQLAKEHAKHTSVGALVTRGIAAILTLASLAAVIWIGFQAYAQQGDNTEEIVALHAEDDVQLGILKELKNIVAAQEAGRAQAAAVATSERVACAQGRMARDWCTLHDYPVPVR